MYVLSEPVDGDILNGVNVNTFEIRDPNTFLRLLEKYNHRISFNNAVRCIYTTEFKIELKNDCIL